MLNVENVYARRQVRSLSRGQLAARSGHSRRLREFWVIAHRWAGLSMTLFLVLVSITGAMLAFYHELHRATANWVHVAPVERDARLLDPIALMASVERAAPEARFNRLELAPAAEEALVYFPESRSAQALAYDEIALNPYTGDEVYRGVWGDLGEGLHQIMPFIFQLHYTIALGETGRILLGMVALIWTLDTFVAFGLTLPVSMRRWLRNWRKAWQIRFRSSGWWRINFDLHRAGGLWLWPMLLVFAWSSVAFNLREVYTPVMQAFGATDVFDALPDKPVVAVAVHDWQNQLKHARRLAAEMGEANGFVVAHEDALTWRAGSDTYEYRYRASDDLPTTGAQSRLFFDRQTGDLVAWKRGEGDFSANGLHEWLMALHMANIGGLPYRIFVACFGLLTTVLAITGVVIWMRKRSARLLTREKRLQGGQVASTSLPPHRGFDV